MVLTLNEAKWSDVVVENIKNSLIEDRKIYI
jgi:hypothetical protein